MVNQSIVLSEDQEDALKRVVGAIRSKAVCVTMGGYAGVGKTVLIAEIVRELRKDFPRIAFCCYTGKAFKVLESKLIMADVLGDTSEGGSDYCGTIHGLVYNAREVMEEKELEDGTKEQKLHMRFDQRGIFGSEYDLIVVDEASMVNQEIYEELLKFKVPILAVGDHGQLPPVFGGFNLMENPEIRLTRIHRQAENDPIIRLSVTAREDGDIEFGEYGENCRKVRGEAEINQIQDPRNWMIITGTNKKRVERNKWARWRLGLDPKGPVAGDRVVCLKNLHGHHVFNGMTGTIKGITKSWRGDHWYRMKILMDSGTEYESDHIFKYQFNQPKLLMASHLECPGLDPREFGHMWDYGYALTCHKAQGSESENVIVYEENFMKSLMFRTQGDEGWRRWLYTAVTRAKKRLIIVGE